MLPLLHDPDGHEARFYTIEEHTSGEPGEVRRIEEGRREAVSGSNGLDPVFSGVGDHACVAWIPEHLGDHNGGPGASSGRMYPFGVEGFGEAVGRFARHEVLEDPDDDIGLIRDKLFFALAFTYSAICDAALGDSVLGGGEVLAGDAAGGVLGGLEGHHAGTGRLTGSAAVIIGLVDVSWCGGWTHGA